MTRRLRFRILTCKRCGYKWIPKVAMPTLCPNCRSPYWNKPRIRRRQSQE